MQNVNRNYFSDVKRYHPSIAQVLDNNRDQRAGYMASLMEQGKREGLIRENLKSQIASFLLMAQFDFLFNIDVYETIFMNFIRGIATSKGIMFIDEFVDRTENA